MLELAQEVIEATNSNSTIEFLPLPKDDPTRRRPDLTLARELFGFEPQVELREGIVKTADYFTSIR